MLRQKSKQQQLSSVIPEAVLNFQRKKNHIKVRVTNSSEPPYGIRQWSGESGGEAGVIVAVPVVMDPVLMDSRATPAMAVHRVRLD